MGLILQTPSAVITPNASLDLLNDIALYEEFSEELTILHTISYEPENALIEKLLEKISLISG